MKRKLFSIILCAALAAALTACGSTDETPAVSPDQSVALEATPSAAQETSEPEAEAEPEVQVSEEAAPKPEQIDINIAAIKGPTGVGMAYLMEQNENGLTANRYHFTVSAAPDEVTSKLITGEYDMAALPTNVAANLYAKTGGEVQTAAINTLGVLYVLVDKSVEAEEITSLEQLAGRKVYATGQGSNPEFVLNHLLRLSGLEPGVDVEIEYLGTHDELVALAAAGEAGICMLPEPNVSSAMTKNENLVIAIDLSERWNESVQDGSNLTMGALVVRREFAENHPEAVQAFLNEYRQSVEYINGDVESAAILVEKHGIVPSAAIAERAIPNCNIVLITGQDMKPAIEGYYQVLFDAEPKSIGGAVPDDDFYYVG